MSKGPPPAQLFSLSIERRNLRGAVWSDLYHYLIARSWTRLLGLVAAVYLAVNTLFACLYLLGHDAVTGAHGFAEHFFFSVETMSTIGYGTMSPRTPYAHVLVTLQAFSGTLFLAVVTGLVFSKFARPTARVLWSRHVVFVERDGQPQLQFRMANERANQIVEATVRVSLGRNETASDGERMRRFHDLKLVRDRNIFFALTWTAIHHITPDSPLYGLTFEQMQADQVQLICSLVGLDETFAQTVHSRKAYVPQDFVRDQRFADLLGTDDQGRRYVDYAHFDRLVPMGTRTPERP